MVPLLRLPAFAGRIGVAPLDARIKGHRLLYGIPLDAVVKIFENEATRVDVSRLHPKRDRVGFALREVQLWTIGDADALVDAIELVGRVGVAKAISGEGGTVDEAVVSLVGFVQRIAIEGIVGHDAIGEVDRLGRELSKGGHK